MLSTDARCHDSSAAAYNTASPYSSEQFITVHAPPMLSTLHISAVKSMSAGTGVSMQFSVVKLRVRLHVVTCVQLRITTSKRR